MAKLTPYIISEDSRAQAAFYISSLGGEIVSVMTHGQMGDASEANKDKVMHMVVAVAGINLFMGDFDGHTHGNSMSLNLESLRKAKAAMPLSSFRMAVMCYSLSDRHLGAAFMDSSWTSLVCPG